MATIRALSGNDSLTFSRSWRDYVFCCFVRSGPQSAAAGQRGAANPSKSGESRELIVDYGSRQSENVQMIHPPAADDDCVDRADAQANIRPLGEHKGQRQGQGQEREEREEEERHNCRTDCSAFVRGPSIESKDLPETKGLSKDQSIDNSASRTSNAAARLNTTTTSEGERRTIAAIAAEVSSCGSHRPLVKADQRKHEGTSNHVTNDDSRNSKPDGRTTTETEGGGGVQEEHQTSLPPSDVSVFVEDVASSPRCHAPAEFKHGASEQDTSDRRILFDVSDFHLDKSSLFVSPCGSIRLTLAYNEIRELMNVTVHEARDIPSHERGMTQVHMLLLPARKIRQKTKAKPSEGPQFEETFDFHSPRENLSDMGLRIRLYGRERFRRESLIGEAIVAFSSAVNAAVDSSSVHTTWIVLKPRNSFGGLGDSLSDVSSLAPSDSGSSSSQSMQHGGPPELMIGLAYNAATGRLSAEVIKGSNFRNMVTKRPPDTYVKVTLTAPNGQKISRSKTSVRRGKPNPLFKETFVFQVAQFQLTDVSLLVSVFAQRSLKRKEMVGWFSLGTTSSSEEEQGHWSAMLSSKGEQVCRWHALLEP